MEISVEGEAAVGNVLTNVKVVMVPPRMEVDSLEYNDYIVCQIPPGQSIELLQQNQELPRELTSDDVFIERITNQEVSASKSEPAPIVEGDHSCVGCGRKCKSVVALRKHEKSCNRCSDDVVNRKCSFCPHSTTSEESLRKHVEMNHSGGSIRSPTNQKATIGVVSYERFENCANRHIDGRFPCNKCGRTYKFRIGSQHALLCDRSIHETDKHKCSFCSYECKWVYALEKHINSVHPAEAINRLTCSACGKFYSRIDNLKAHQKLCENLNSTILTYKCTICPYEAKLKHILQIHMKSVHTVLTTDRSVCSKCGRAFKHIDKLKKHEKNCDKCDNATLKFQCSDCPYKTHRKRHLNEHKGRVHPEEAIDRPQCAGCEKSFKALEYLRKHLQYCEKSNIEIVKHKCSICLYETKRKDCLKLHMKRIHPVWDRLTCMKQGKPVSENYLEVNNKYNEKSIKYKCSVCLYESKYKNNLKKHIDAVHPIEVVDRLSCAGWNVTFVNSDRTGKKLEET